VTAAGALLAWPALSSAQPARRFRVGCLWTSNEFVVRPYRDAFLAGMRDRGYVAGRNLTFDERHAEGNPGRYASLVAELLALKPDILVGIEAVAAAYRSKTATMPIVLVASVNPVAAGLVKSFARPGTNVTGLSFRLDELIAKQIELLTEITPSMSRVALFNVAVRPGDPGIDSAALFEQVARKAASDKGLGLVVVAALNAQEARNAFARLQNEKVQGLVVVASGQTLVLRDEIIGEARRLRLPSISALPAEFAERGGLATYGPNFLESYRYAAKYVDRILKGAKPANLPVQRPTAFETAINLKTAKQLGVKVPQSILLRADQVIE
jgi:putative ABC transport system substrate-binding protein